MLNNIYKEITILLIGYKSTNKIIDIIKKIPKKLKIIIIENSNDIILKKNIKKYNNIEIYLKKNNGVSSSINFASNKIKTKYFLQISPDIKFNFKKLEIFLKVARKLNDKFSALGPRFINANEKSHKQIKRNIKIGSIKSVHGSCMFINKKRFKEIGGFDNNFFLYFEETDYCRRGNIKNLKCYQINSIKVKSIGRSVKLKNKANIIELENLLTWHFIWSEFNYNSKIYGKIITIIIFLPKLVRSLIKKYLFKLLNNKKIFDRYNYRIKGLMAGILNKKSSLRLKTNY